MPRDLPSRPISWPKTFRHFWTTVSWWMMLNYGWWMMLNDRWWMKLNDRWWMMLNDRWWMMLNDGWWMMVDDGWWMWWMMDDDGNAYFDDGWWWWWWKYIPVFEFGFRVLGLDLGFWNRMLACCFGCLPAMFLKVAFGDLLLITLGIGHCVRVRD